MWQIFNIIFRHVMRSSARGKFFGIFVGILGVIVIGFLVVDVKEDQLEDVCIDGQDGDDVKY